MAAGVPSSVWARSGPRERAIPDRNVPLMAFLERIGNVLGFASAPIAAVAAVARRGRVFHPRGDIYAATVTAARTGPGARAGTRLAGNAVVRVSGAWWRRVEWPDVLGVAVRFRGRGGPSVQPAEGDQDLLFATLRRPWTMLLAPLSTDPHDFLANDYYAVSPFDDPDLGRVEWRLRTGDARARFPGRDRYARLRAAARGGEAVLRLEARSREARFAGWVEVARIRLDEVVELDAAALRFRPFRSGRGIRPRGFIHALRPGAYGGSQAARTALRRARPNGRGRRTRTRRPAAT